METFTQKKIRQSPLYFVLVTVLFAAACVVFPTEWLSDFVGTFIAKAIVRMVFGLAAVVFLLVHNQKQCFKFSKALVKNIDILIAGLLIAVNNFPIIAFCSGNVVLTANANELAAYIFLCFSIGFFEEIFFRAIVFSLLLIYFENKGKYAALWAVLVSSALFALMHAFNLLGGFTGAVMLQIGYTFLNGMLYAVVYYMTRSIWSSILCHTLFDIGGLLLSYKVASGRIWDTATIILTIVVSVLVIAWLCYRFLKPIFKKEYSHTTSN